MSSITSFCITKCQYATWYSHQQGTFGYAIQPYLKSANIQIQYIDCLIRIIYQLIYKYIIQDTRQYIVLHHPHDFLPHLFPAIFSFPKLQQTHTTAPVTGQTGSQGARDFRLDLIRSAENMRILKPWVFYITKPTNEVEGRSYLLGLGGWGRGKFWLQSRRHKFCWHIL